VRRSECDPFRHANHRPDFEWFKETLNRYLESLALPALSAASPSPVMAQHGIRYFRPLGMATRCWSAPARCGSGAPASRWSTRCGVAVLCAKGRANATGEKVPPPPDLRRAILARDPAKSAPLLKPVATAIQFYMSETIHRSRSR
jgi:hypothetical protein